MPGGETILLMSPIRNSEGGLGKLVKYLLHKLKDLSSNPRTGTKLSAVLLACSPSLGRWGQVDSLGPVASQQNQCTPGSLRDSRTKVWLER